MLSKFPGAPPDSHYGDASMLHHTPRENLAYFFTLEWRKRPNSDPLAGLGRPKKYGMAGKAGQSERACHIPGGRRTAPLERGEGHDKMSKEDWRVHDCQEGGSDSRRQRSYKCATRSYKCVTDAIACAHSPVSAHSSYTPDTGCTRRLPYPEAIGTA